VVQHQVNIKLCG